MESIPKDILKVILQFLPEHERIHYELVSKTWLQIIYETATEHDNFEYCITNKLYLSIKYYFRNTTFREQTNYSLTLPIFNRIIKLDNTSTFLSISCQNMITVIKYFFHNKIILYEKHICEWQLNILACDTKDNLKYIKYICDQFYKNRNYEITLPFDSTIFNILLAYEKYETLNYLLDSASKRNYLYMTEFVKESTYLGMLNNKTYYLELLNKYDLLNIYFFDLNNLEVSKSQETNLFLNYLMFNKKTITDKIFFIKFAEIIKYNTLENIKLFIKNNIQIKDQLSLAAKRGDYDIFVFIYNNTTITKKIKQKHIDHHLRLSFYRTSNEKIKEFIMSQVNKMIKKN